MRRYIACLADTQLYKRLYGLEETRNDWYNALRQAFRHIESRADEVACVLLLGDVFDTKEVGPQAVFHITEALQSLQAAKIPIGVILGNHDHDPNENLSWIDVCRVANPLVSKLSLTQPLFIPAEGPLAPIAILGTDHQPRSQIIKSVQGLLKPTGLPSDTQFWLCLHEALEELAPHKDAWEISTMHVPGFVHRTLLGDFHDMAEHIDAHGRSFLYPGSIETVSHNQSKTPGFVYIDRQTGTYEHISTQQRAYLTIQLNGVSPERWGPHVHEQIDQAYARFKAKPVVRVFFPNLLWDKWEPLRAEAYARSLHFEDFAEVYENTPAPQVATDDRVVETKEDVKAMAIAMLEAEGTDEAKALIQVLSLPTAIADIKATKFPTAVYKKD